MSITFAQCKLDEMLATSVSRLGLEEEEAQKMMFMLVAWAHGDQVPMHESTICTMPQACKYNAKDV